MKLEYNLNRLQQFKKEVLTKARKNLMVPPTNKRATEVGISGPPKDKERSFSEANINKNDIEIKKNFEEDEENYRVERNQIVKKKCKNNSKKLLSCKLKDNLIETLNNYKFNIKNEETKNHKEKEKKKINSSQGTIYLKSRYNNNDNNQSGTYIINKLRESIMEKQKKIELKKEQYFKIIEDINRNKKEKMKKQLENSSSLNANSMNNIDISINNIKSTESNSIRNIRVLNRENFLNINPINNYNSISYKILNQYQNNKNLLTLPPIESNKKEKNNLPGNLKTECEPKINHSELNKKMINKKNNEHSNFNDLYKLTSISPSFIKDKFIVFQSPHRPVREDYITIDNDYKSKPKSQRPVRLIKNYSKNLENLSDNDNEDKKIDYINIVAFNNQVNNKNTIENNIKEKYKELSVLVKSLQKTTEEMLDKKEQIF